MKATNFGWNWYCILNFFCSTTPSQLSGVMMFNQVQQICVDKFVSSPFFLENACLPWQENPFKAHFLRFAHFCRFLIFSENWRLAQGDYKVKEWNQHISVLGGGLIYIYIYVYMICILSVHVIYFGPYLYFI